MHYSTHYKKAQRVASPFCNRTRTRNGKQVMAETQSS
jgi:hypothetical protein